MNLLITIIACLITAVVFFFLGVKKGKSIAAKATAAEETPAEADETPTEEQEPATEEPAEEKTAVEEPAVEVKHEEVIAVEEEPAEEDKHEEVIASEEEPAEEEPVEKEKHVEEPTEEEETAEEEPVTQNQELVASLHKLLEEDKVYLQPDIRIDDVARMIYTNRTYVTRMMRQEYGLTFIEYVNVSRIQHSQHLLYSYNMTLDEVAIKSGFQSTSNYCRAFKRLIGTSPLAWIQQVKGPTVTADTPI